VIVCAILRDDDKSLTPQQARDLAALKPDLLPNQRAMKPGCNGPSLQNAGRGFDADPCGLGAPFRREHHHPHQLQNPGAMPGESVVKMIAEYLERALEFENMAAEATDAILKEALIDQALAYRRLATERAQKLRVPIPPKPPDQKGSP
jgi:hypothetical protein